MVAKTAWPIAAAMIPFPGIGPDGRSVQEQTPEQWHQTLYQVAHYGFTELDPTDSWLRIADLSKTALHDFLAVTSALNLTIPAISTSRRSVIDPVDGDANLQYSHRVIDTASAVGAKAVSFGLFEPLTEQQKAALWFWTVNGVQHRDQSEQWHKAVSRITDLGRHAASVGIEISLEMYEDTYLGTAESAVRFVEDVDLDNVGINADLGNLIRMHRPVESWQSMMLKVAPFAKYWHVKNYTRVEDADRGLIFTHPAPLECGIIDYRSAVSTALAAGFKSAFLCEHYGGDGLAVSARNRKYLLELLGSLGRSGIEQV